MSPLLVALAATLVLSLVTFAAFGIDKRRARLGGRRIPERTLHGLAALGGWPGALAGRRFFRHKTRKRRFTAVLLLISVLHLAAWIALLARALG